MNNAEKIALLEKVAPLFPKGRTLPKHDGQSFETLVGFARGVYESHLLGYWQALAPAYRQALSEPFGTDSAQLETSIEDWPTSFSAQQKALHDLLQTSKLRTSWRSLCRWREDQRSLLTDGQRQVLDAMEREVHECNLPIKEIPLYESFMRTSCQQVIGMPVSVWESMYKDSAQYDPAKIDPATTERQATRIAQVLNAPPVAPLNLLQETPSWREAIVWLTSQRGLTACIDLHGKRDRVAECSERESDSPLTFPEWRFDGFCGQIRVLQEDGTPWYVTVLAPAHFVRRLVLYAHSQAGQ